MSTTLKKCLRILETLAESDTPRGISELARDLRLNKSAVQRIISTLSNERYIEKHLDTGRYRPTLRLWEMGARVISQNETRRLLQPTLRYASKVSGLTVYLAWADFPDVIYLDKIEGEKGRANSSDPGHRIPMHLAASGRSILAFLDQKQIDRVLAPLAKGPGRATVDELRKELRDIRQRLYAFTERGSATKVSSVAAPIWASAPEPVGSLVLTSDSATLPADQFDRVGAIAMTAAEQATRVLGGSYPSLDDSP